MMPQEVVRSMGTLTRIVLAAILLLSLSGSAAAQSTTEDEDAASPTTLPMGHLVFTSDRADGDLDLWVIEAGSSEAVRLTTAYGADRTPAVSPDGGSVAFASASSCRFVLSASASCQVCTSASICSAA